MTETENPYSAGMPDEPKPNPPRSLGRHGHALPIGMIVCGIAVGFAGLALVSNQFGNTDTYGLPVVALGGYLLGTGICHLFTSLRYAALIGLVAGPFSLALLFLAYWIGLFATAAFR